MKKDDVEKIKPQQSDDGWSSIASDRGPEI
jgi:hypothetical protein